MSEKVENGKILWKSEAITILVCFEKRKSRFKFIGRSAITSYISLVLMEKMIFNLLWYTQSCSNKHFVVHSFNWNITKCFSL